MFVVFFFDSICFGDIIDVLIMVMAMDGVGVNENLIIESIFNEDGNNIKFTICFISLTIYVLIIVFLFDPFCNNNTVCIISTSTTTTTTTTTINSHIINVNQIFILYIVSHRCFMLITNTNTNQMLILFSLFDYALLTTEIGSVTNWKQ